MATDITTLAIALQSKEAESNLKIFNELLATGSTNAKKMERMTIGVDVDAALQQLNALRTSYEEIAKTAQNIHFDMGINPEMFAPKAEPSVDASALEELKAFFQEQAEAVRKQAELVSDAMEKMGAGAESAGGSVRTAGESMRGAGAAAGEYALKVREVAAAKKELEKLAAKADADGQAAYEADKRARDAKHDLIVAERELQKVSEQLSKTHMGGAGDIMALAEKEDALKTEVQNLTEAYRKAQEEADKFGAKLDVSAGKADEARAHYNQLKTELTGMPGPTTNAAGAVDSFEKNAKRAGTTATKLARGFNAVAFAGGAAVPGLTKVGMAISMFSYAGPYVGAAVVGLGLLSVAIKKVREQSELEAQYIRENAERALKSVQATKEFVSASENDWKRLGELSDVGTLTNSQNEEATSIISRLTEVYGALGIEIDKATGKLKGYAEAREKASGTDKELQRETLRHAKEMAKINAINQVKSFYNSSGDSFVRARNQEILSTLTDKALSDSEKQKAINLYKERLQRVVAGMEKMTYQTQTYKHTEGSVYQTTQTYEISQSEAAETLKHVEDLEKAWRAASEAKRNLDKYDEKELEEKNKKFEAAAKAYTQAQNGLVAENGKWRLETDEDASNKRIARLDEIENALKDEKLEEAKRLELKAEYFTLTKAELQYKTRIRQQEEREAEAAKRTAEAENQKAIAAKKASDATAERIKALQKNLVFDRKGTAVREKTLDEQSADRREEIARLKQQVAALSVTAARRDATAEELLQWGGRYNPATGKMNGDQKQAGWRGILSDGKGGVMTEVSTGVKIDGKEVEIPLIVPESTKEDLQRIAKIANGELTDIPEDLLEKALSFAKKRIAEGKSAFFNGDKEDESLRNIDDITELYEAQTKLLQLQTQDAKYRDQLKAANEARANAGKGYVFDDNGAVLRKRTEEELNQERQKELADARKRVEAAEKGTVERAQAEAELTRLEIEAYNARKKSSAATVMSEARANNTRLVQGVEARSSAALALESRVFHRDDSEKAIMRDSKDIQTDIKDAVNKLVTGFTDFSATFANVKDLLQPL